MEIQHKTKQIEFLDSPIVVPKIEKKYKSSAKSVKGLINGLLIKFERDKRLTPEIRYSPEELIITFREAIRKYEDVKNAKNLINIEIIDGWKGTDKLDIWKGITNDFLIESHNKDKESGAITTTRHEIRHDDFNRVLFFIKSWEIGESHKCYDFAEVLGFKTWKDLWRERKIYFAQYYFPIKIIEKLKLIKYSGRGQITRLM